MLKKTLWVLVVAIVLSGIGIWLYPSPPVVPPVTVAKDEREAHRHLAFEGIANFRDIGGYPTEDGRTVRWGLLYRSGQLSGTTGRDRKDLEALGLSRVIDFRSQLEQDNEPSHFPKPVPFEVVNIPVLDEGNATIVEELAERINTGNFEGFSPNEFMTDANVQFVRNFTPQFNRFMYEVLQVNGEPVLWHCTAGKDRTGFAAAVLLRTLGVPEDIVMRDYMLSERYSLEAAANQLMLLRMFKGEEAEAVVSELMGVREHWLQAAFNAIDEDYGSFESYLLVGLGLGDADIEILRNNLLE